MDPDEIDSDWWLEQEEMSSRLADDSTVDLT